MRDVKRTCNGTQQILEGLCVFSANGYRTTLKCEFERCCRCVFS